MSGTQAHLKLLLLCEALPLSSPQVTDLAFLWLPFQCRILVLVLCAGLLPLYPANLTQPVGQPRCHLQRDFLDLLSPILCNQGLEKKNTPALRGMNVNSLGSSHPLPHRNSSKHHSSLGLSSSLSLPQMYICETFTIPEDVCTRQLYSYSSSNKFSPQESLGACRK